MKRNALLVSWLLALLLPALSYAQTITVENGTSRTLYELYVSPSAGQAWGRDLLGDGVLQEGGSVDVVLKAAGRYDIMAIDEIQRQYYVADEELAAGRRILITDRARREGRALPESVGYGWIRLLNDTGFTVHYVYVSPGYAGSWEEGEQVLPGNRVLESGEEYLVQIDISKYRTTVYDFLLIDEDRDRYAKWDVDLETAAVLEVTLEDIQWN